MNWSNLKSQLKKWCPIYINTLNVFRSLRTWWHNRNIAEFPRIEVKLRRRNFDWLEENLYTWYWWEHMDQWDFKHKWILVLIDDVFIKTKYGEYRLEQVPFILIRAFGWNLWFRFHAPKSENDYEYWEKMKIDF